MAVTPIGEGERVCSVAGIEICFERFGSASDPTVLLVMGLGMQMIGWHEDFCAQLAGRGFQVVRFDNRDAGRSTRLDGAFTPTIKQLLTRRFRPAYTLADMAGDSVGVLDAIGVERAHVVGASMGAMIAQTIAARHPDRVLSLSSLMSNTGARWRGRPALGAYRVLMTVAPRDLEEYVEQAVVTASRIGSPGFPRDDDAIRELALRSHARGLNPPGTRRQLGAIVAAGDRTRDLRGITAPTVVIHGDRDRLVRPSGATATVRAIPGARLLKIPGMGHDLPRDAWPTIIDAIAGNAARATRP